jgi:arylsulfatase A-like enzyme
MRAPGGEGPRGQRVETIVEAIDVLPTMLDYAAIQSPPQLQGKSLRPLVAGESDVTRREMALTEHHGWKTLRTPGFRYLMQDDGQELLFDVTQDPQELTDISGDEAYEPVLVEHRRLLLTKLVERERPRERTWTY